MEPGAASSKIYRFGLFETDVAKGTLTRNGIRVKLQDQPFRVLIFLLERPGEIVTRDELRQRLWPEGTYVDFDGSLNVILKKLRAAIDDDSDNPRFIETVPRRGYRFIAPVSSDLAVAPPKTQSTSPLDLPAIEAAPVAIKVPQSQILQRPWYRPPLITVALLLLGLISAGILRYHKPAALADSSRPDAPVNIRKSVAILGFHSLTGKAEDVWLGTALSEMLSTELSGGEKLRLVSGEEVANLRVASPWSQTDTLDQNTTSRIGNALSSDILVLGSYTTLGNREHGQVRIDVRMQDARTGEILSEIAEIGSSQDLFLQVSRVGAKLRDRLGIPRLRDNEEAGVLASLPMDPDTSRLYALGIAKLRQFDALAAKDLLQQATQLDPKFALGHAMLARAWSQLGYGQNYREEAKKAFDLTKDLPRAEHMIVEGEYYASVGNQEQAASVYHALFELLPDDVDYGLRFCNAAILSGNASQALQVIHQLRSLPAPASDDPRIDLTESAAIKVNKPASLALIRSAVRKASAQGKMPLYARARSDECMTLLYGEAPESGVPVCEDAYNLFLSEGNRAGAADTIRLIADRRGTEGRFEEAIATYERALLMLKGLGEYAKTGAILNNMAIGYANEGKLDRAAELYKEAKADFELGGDKGNTATAVTNIADILYLQGNLPAAEKMYQQSLELIAVLDNGEPGYALTRIADLELTTGKLQQAKLHAQQAIDSMRPVEGGYQYLSGAIIELGEVLMTEGDFAGARSKFDESMAMRQKMGAADLVAENQVEFAVLSMEEGHPETAESLLRTAITEFEKEKVDPDSTAAYTELSRALLMQGKINDARAAAERAVQLSASSADPSLKLPASIQKVRVNLASGGAANSASQELRSVITTAHRLGYYTVECEGRLALGEAVLKANVSSGRTQLSAFASEARSRGFELAGRHADQLVAASSSLAEAQRNPH